MLFFKKVLVSGIGLISCGVALCASHPKLVIRVLSGPPDMVTGGDALVEVSGLSSGKTQVSLNAQDVTNQLRPGGTSGTLLGKIDGLKAGSNVLEVSVGSQRGKLHIVNHPISGPVFSGPHQTPFICETSASGLGAPLDADCSAKTVVRYYYRSTSPPEANASAGAALKPLDPSATLPNDVAQTTTTEGKTVNFIVRRETGTINRAVYEISFLHQPGERLPDPWTDSRGWNRRLVYFFGAGIGSGFHQGRLPPGYWSPGGLDLQVLGKGYAEASSSLNVLRNTSDDVISAETLLMVKEYFIERFGVPAHTIGLGGSGGAIGQYLVAQNYPGLLDGIIPVNSFPDVFTTVPSVIECGLLAHVFDSSKQVWTDAEKAAASGFAIWGTCVNQRKSLFSANALGQAACDASISKQQIYDPDTNPKGVRCTLQDNQVNVWGRDPATGYARRPFDNVGVQYGLAAFNSGVISAEKFLDLNEYAGGYDINGKIVPARTAADHETLRIAYQTGRVNSGSHLSSIPIIDIRQYVDRQASGDANTHDRVRSLTMRERIKQATKSQARNMVILTHETFAGYIAALLQAVLDMDRWLDNISRDKSSQSAAAKVGRNKPAGLVDACWTAAGEKIEEMATYGGSGRCSQLFPAHGNPRIAAGGPLTDAVLKCTLKPVTPADYQRPLTADQLTRLKSIFPQGVCDYNHPGVQQSDNSQAWRRY